MRSGILRIVSAAFVLATLGLGNVAAYAAEPATPVDSNRTIGDDSPFGAYLFHNDNGWHFRTHGNPQGTKFSAHIASNGTIHDVVAIRDENADHIKLDGAGHALELSFATSTGLDGVDFRLDDPGFLRARIEANGQLLPVDNIFLGDDGRHPATNPFALRLGELRIPDNLKTGYTLLRDDDRLKLLTHDNEGSHTYTGTLTTSGTMEVVDLVRPEKDDSVSVSSDGHTVSFKFGTQEAVDGVVLRVTGAEKVNLTLDTDGQLTPVSRIHLGSKDRSPRTNPFEIRA
jgi:hypothetical protein